MTTRISSTETREHFIAAKAVQDSTGRNEIVWLREGIHAIGADYPAICAELAALAEDSVKDGARVEFWGTPPGGVSWRVHVVTA